MLGSVGTKDAHIAAAWSGEVGEPADVALNRSVAAVTAALLKSPLRRSQNAAVLLVPSLRSVRR